MFTLVPGLLLVDKVDVNVKAMLAVEGLGAFRTLEALITLVRVLQVGVLPQVRGLREGFLAVAAFERQRIIVNLLLVSDNQGLAEESQATGLADEVENPAVSTIVVPIQTCLIAELLTALVALVLLDLVVEVVLVIGKLLLPVERLLATLATKFGNVWFWFIEKLRSRVFVLFRAVVVIQLRLEGELGSTGRTKMKLPILVEERDVVFQGQLGVEGPEALFASELVVVFRLKLRARPMEVLGSKLHRMELGATPVALERVETRVLQTHVAVKGQDILLADVTKARKAPPTSCFLDGKTSLEHSAFGGRRSPSDELLSDLQRPSFYDLTETLRRREFGAALAGFGHRSDAFGDLFDNLESLGVVAALDVLLGRHLNAETRRRTCVGLIGVNLEALFELEICVTLVALVTLKKDCRQRLAGRLGAGVVVPAKVVQQFESRSVGSETLPAHEAVLLLRLEMLLQLVLPQVPTRRQNGITV